jgi:hypothetical protein
MADKFKALKNMPQSKMMVSQVQDKKPTSKKLDSVDLKCPLPYNQIMLNASREANSMRFNVNVKESRNPPNYIELHLKEVDSSSEFSGSKSALSTTSDEIVDSDQSVSRSFNQALNTTPSTQRQQQQQQQQQSTGRKVPVVTQEFKIKPLAKVVDKQAVKCADEIRATGVVKPPTARRNLHPSLNYDPKDRQRNEKANVESMLRCYRPLDRDEAFGSRPLRNAMNAHATKRAGKFGLVKPPIAKRDLQPSLSFENEAQQRNEKDKEIESTVQLTHSLGQDEAFGFRPLYRPEDNQPNKRVDDFRSAGVFKPIATRNQQPDLHERVKKSSYSPTQEEIATVEEADRDFCLTRDEKPNSSPYASKPAISKCKYFQLLQKASVECECQFPKSKLDKNRC